MAGITMKNIVKRYPDGFLAVDDISIDVADGEFVILVGPSGCGKSTLLRMIVGLEDITEGEMLINGARVNEKAPRDRNLSMVFQNYALYPHLNVFENIAFPLRLKNMPDAEVTQRVEDAAAVLELTEHLKRKPANLSGGQRQRVAMGRAIVRKADAFLFDEPLSNLDAKLRGQMRTEISRIQRRLGTTTVYVTHDQTEAMTLGDRIAVLRKGVLQQIGSPHQLYDTPANLFVAGFIGSPPMNFIPGRLKDGAIETPLGDVAVTDRLAGTAGHDLVIVGVRPQDFEDSSGVDPAARAHGETFTAHVDVTEWLGNELYAYIPYDAPKDVTLSLKELQRDLDSEQMRTQLVVVLGAQSKVTDGSVTDLWFDNDQIHVFDPATGDNLTQYAAKPELVESSSPASEQVTSSDPRATAQQTEE
ncbi:MAG TPA: sn-glycerol-3-phosphate ABC transporter ATP-binding protein UgpC [Actinomycetes bacterium]|nr:sn-glycerol-3-phosphate ABC transporter ATP-binding protein UgpC [Actinomycetes bacterium]